MKLHPSAAAMLAELRAADGWVLLSALARGDGDRRNAVRALRDKHLVDITPPGKRGFGLKRIRANATGRTILIETAVVVITLGERAPNTRRCPCCRKYFKFEHRGNYICAPCKELPAFHSAVDDMPMVVGL